MVGLTFVRGLDGDRCGSGDSAFAATGRFGEVFSKLRAGYCALSGDALGAPVGGVEPVARAVDGALPALLVGAD